MRREGEPLTKGHSSSDAGRPHGLSRREFVRLAALGLLAGCRPATGPVVVTATPSPTPTRPAVPTPLPPSDALSRVVRARDAHLWQDGALVPEAIDRVLDTAITQLTGLGDVAAAWASMFDPSERVGIKVNTISSSDFWTHEPLVAAVTERLRAVGVPAEQIVIFDRSPIELEWAGFSVNEDGPGVRCYGTGLDYSPGWAILGNDIRLSDILLDCDALINMPILKQHSDSGVTFAMKNHFGCFIRPEMFHRPRTGQAIAELNALPPIRERTRLIVGDVLTICPASPGGWDQAYRGDSILASTDPVAHDAVGLQILSHVLAAAGRSAEGSAELASEWLAASSELGLGVSDPAAIELVEVESG